MYKILVVDDEPRVSTGIKNFLLGSDLSITHVETALNGFEAIDYLRMDTFDMVLTDIQMSRMSGLELMETIYMEQPNLPVVVISAHEKFDFAKKSLRLGARDYLIKPVEREELIQVVRGVLLEKEEIGKQSLALSRQLDEEKSGKARRDEILMELVTEKDLTKQDYDGIVEELGDQLQGGCFGVIAVRLDLSRGGFSDQEVTLQDRKLLKYASLNIVQESLSDWRGTAFNGYGNELVGIIELNDRELSERRVELKSQLHLIGQMIYMNLKQYLNVETTIGMSTVHADVFMLPRLMEEAEAAAEWRKLHPDYKVFYYEDMMVLQGNYGIMEWIAKVDAYMHALKMNIDNPLYRDRHAIVQELRMPGRSRELLRSYFGLLVYRLYGLLLEYGHDGGRSLSRFDPDVYFRGDDDGRRVERLDAYIDELIVSLRAMIAERDQTIIARITGYIREHYRNSSLKIQDIAGEVHFSAAYLGYLFKRETSQNIWDYVTELRIEEAKRLLATTDKKRYEVAYDVGYESPEHFGRMFKRYTGASPAEYRKEGRGIELKLKYKVTLAFALFIVGPFLIVGWISAYKASDSLKEEVGRTTLQLVKQNHVTLEKTLAAINDRTITLLDNHFFSDAEQYTFWTNIETLGEIGEADSILERWSRDGTEYTLYMVNTAGKRTPFDLSHKLKGFKYLNPDQVGLPEWAEHSLRERGGGTLRLIDSGSGTATVSFMRSILNPRAYSEFIGFLIVSKLEVLLTRDLVSVQLPENAGIYLFNGQDELLMKDGSAEPHMDSVPEPARSQETGYYFATEDGKKWLYAYSHRSAFNTRLIYKIPLDSITGNQNLFQWMMMILSAIYLAFVLAFVLYLLRIIVKPLTRLVVISKIYEPGKKLNMDGDPPRLDEFGILYGAFLKMTDRLDRSIEENYVMKIKQKENELSTLHSQITPHLLYNTLDSIYWYAVDSGNTDVGDMVKDLSKLLRIGLSKGKTMITIGEEVEHVQAYSRLQMKRYPDTFEVYWDIDEAVKSYMTPKVILQPLVENAIFHGVSSMDGEGAIWIRIRRSGEEIRMMVEDNGFLPVDMERLEAIVKGEIGDKGYGIRNVHQRVQLHFGEAYGLRYDRRAEGGLTASINLPLQENR